MEKETFELENELNQIKEAIQNENYHEFLNRFHNLHDRDQADFFLALNENERVKLYHYLSPIDLADLFDSMENYEEDHIDYLKEMDTRYLADILNEMYTDNVVSLLENFDKLDINYFLTLMSRERSNEIRKILQYAKETAGSIMTTEYIAVYINQTVSSVMKEIKEKAPDAETIYYLYAVDEMNRLLGVVSLRDLIVSEDETFIKEIMIENIISVNVLDDQEDVAHIMSDYDFLAVPVIDETQHLQGIITVDDIIDVIEEERDSDYSGLAAVDVSEKATTPMKAAAGRLPWLITLLFLGMGTASLIDYYENLVREAAILAVFISLITGTAGNAGTQSLAVAVRRLSETKDKKNSIRELVKNEIITGLITGVVTGLAIFFIVSVWQQNFVLGFVVAIAMIFAVIMSSIAGSFIPILIEKIGFDPAVASGPFITTLSDLTSVFIYFSIAAIFLPYFV
ncbi:magnesium transporter [Lacticigenium naphthae]|uniref:magnesium transporter n=1 Tax=Lacticigenium naphthae TaxID=515351 RepID=UPI000418A94F|nr:magnesium transporter [Lacticigenium naphthae]